ncbi:DUF58 domain-containing protein [Methylomonas sp. TEB]|uniref:DUF58 domain-containing protein n=1 Tax=Methylomonas sp. TEB TaxID=3398229 RepID=UPI0039F4A002
MSEAALSLKQRFKLSRFFTGEAPTAGPIVLTQRRVFILPTRRGLAFVLLILLLVLIGFVYNNNLAYLLGFLLASIFFVTILHSFKALAGLTIQPARQHAVFAGQAGPFNFQISNPGSQRRFALDLALQSELSISLAAEQTQTVTLYQPTQQRGWQLPGTLTLSSTYPLGLFRAWAPLRFDSPLLVYPKPTSKLLPFPDSDGGQDKPGQNRRSGDEFDGVRVYQRGDAIRQIHWKAFAKGQGVHSKYYRGASANELWLDYQQAPGHHTEERLSQLCRWLVDAEQAGLRYGLVLPGLRLPPDNGAAHYRHCLQALALF